MAAYTFLTTGSISTTDLEQLIELTQAGTVFWRPDDHYTAFIGSPADAAVQDDQSALAAALGANLHGIRLGYTPDSYRWNYLRLVDASGRQHYLEANAVPPATSLCDQLYQLAQKAARLGGRLVSEHDTEHHCDHCQRSTPHRALCDRPYGLPGAIMSGSERLACTVCEHSTSLASVDR